LHIAAESRQVIFEILINLLQTIEAVQLVSCHAKAAEN
jgi:hypothetical protein